MTGLIFWINSLQAIGHYYETASFGWFFLCIEQRADSERFNLFTVCKSQSMIQKINNRFNRTQKYFMTGWVEVSKGQADVMHCGKAHQATAMSPHASLCGWPWHWCHTPNPRSHQAPLDSLSHKKATTIYLLLVQGVEGQACEQWISLDFGTMVETSQICSFCDLNLCWTCFDEYHCC